MKLVLANRVDNGEVVKVRDLFTMRFLEDDAVVDTDGMSHDHLTYYLRRRADGDLVEKKEPIRQAFSEPKHKSIKEDA